MPFHKGVIMLRKLILVGILAGSSASIPMLYESNPALFDRLLKPAESAPEKTPLIAVNRMAPPEPAEVLQGRKVRLVADERGHFSGDFKLNGRKVNAMIDTGATVVAINLSTARRIGVNVLPNDFQHSVNTANGSVRAAAVTIDTLQIGRIFIRDVQAVVLDDKALGGTLIGVSFLSRLGKYQVENGALLMVQ
jgi:aspartyl protease family protein